MNKLDSLHEPEDENVGKTWVLEIEGRMREVEAGTVRTVPWSEARQRILALRDDRRGDRATGVTG